MGVPLADRQSPQACQHGEALKQFSKAMRRPFPQEHLDGYGRIFATGESKRVQSEREARPFQVEGGTSNPFEGLLKVALQARLRPGR